MFQKEPKLKTIKKGKLDTTLRPFSLPSFKPNLQPTRGALNPGRPCGKILKPLFTASSIFINNKISILSFFLHTSLFFLYPIPTLLFCKFPSPSIRLSRHKMYKEKIFLQVPGENVLSMIIPEINESPNLRPLEGQREERGL